MVQQDGGVYGVVVGNKVEKFLDLKGAMYYLWTTELAGRYNFEFRMDGEVVLRCNMTNYDGASMFHISKWEHPTTGFTSWYYTRYIVDEYVKYLFR